MPKINIVHHTEEVAYESKILGLVTMTDDTVSTTQDAYNELKRHFQSIKFRPGDSVSNTKYPGQELKVIDFNHENYFCIDTATFAPINFPFAEAEAWTG